MPKYLVHKAVEFDAITVAARKKLGVTSVEELYGTHTAQRKYDGCNGIMKVSGAGVEILTRTGETVLSCDHLKRAVRGTAMRRMIEAGMSFVLLGELWEPGKDQATISGDVRRHGPAPNLRFIVFDYIPYDDFENGVCGMPFELRYQCLLTYLRGQHPTDRIQLCETYNPGTYGGVDMFCEALLEQGGYDGLILRKPSGTWKAGSGTTGEIIKVKKRKSYDMLVRDIELGKGRNAGVVGSLVLQGPKGIVNCNAGTDAQRKAWAEDPSLIVGQIVEVFCLGFTSRGSLREPTLGEIRFDKEQPDF